MLDCSASCTDYFPVDCSGGTIAVIVDTASDTTVGVGASSAVDIPIVAAGSTVGSCLKGEDDCYFLVVVLPSYAFGLPSPYSSSPS